MVLVVFVVFVVFVVLVVLVVLCRFWRLKRVLKCAVADCGKCYSSSRKTSKRLMLFTSTAGSAKKVWRPILK